MKVVFLDFDGVLNSHDWFMRRPKPQSVEEREFDDFDPDAVARLNKIVTRTRAVVVVSSSWRLGRSKRVLASILRRVGFMGTVLDRTPDRSLRAWERHHEIRAWMRKNPVENYVILDDDSDAAAGEHMLMRFIKTDFAVGLRDEHVEAAVNILNR